MKGPFPALWLRPGGVGPCGAGGGLGLEEDGAAESHKGVARRFVEGPRPRGVGLAVVAFTRLFRSLLPPQRVSEPLGAPNRLRPHYTCPVDRGPSTPPPVERSLPGSDRGLPSYGSGAPLEGIHRGSPRPSQRWREGTSNEVECDPQLDPWGREARYLCVCTFGPLGPGVTAPCPGLRNLPTLLRPDPCSDPDHSTATGREGVRRS